MRARYYDPSIHRFTSEDPHWDTENMIFGDDENAVNPDNSAILQANNLYAYCVNDPINHQDRNDESIGEIDGKILKFLSDLAPCKDVYDFGKFLEGTQEHKKQAYETLYTHAFNVYYADRNRGYVQIDGITNKKINGKFVINTEYKDHIKALHDLLNMDTSKSFYQLTKDEETRIYQTLIELDKWYTSQIFLEYDIKVIKDASDLLYGTGG